MAERPSGYYWVRINNGVPEVAEWSALGVWRVTGSDLHEYEDHVTVLFGPIPGPEELAALVKICAEILEIGESYKRGDSTPGCMEHLGDVQRIFTRWEKALLADAAIAQAAPEQEKP